MAVSHFQELCADLGKDHDKDRGENCVTRLQQKWPCNGFLVGLDLARLELEGQKVVR